MLSEIPSIWHLCHQGQPQALMVYPPVNQHSYGKTMDFHSYVSLLEGNSCKFNVAIRIWIKPFYCKKNHTFTYLHQPNYPIELLCPFLPQWNDDQNWQNGLNIGQISSIAMYKQLFLSNRKLSNHKIHDNQSILWSDIHIYITHPISNHI